MAPNSTVPQQLGASPPPTPPQGNYWQENHALTSAKHETNVATPALPLSLPRCIPVFC